ncbi:MAG TPA: hypothetical protein VNT77_00165 [Allosphingosinicella sp.]|nr:hypothetical protein [Allosphingosinicella sp.]
MAGGEEMKGVPEERRFTPARRARFLEVLALTGNLRAAAEEIGVHRRSVERRRDRDPAFAVDWAAAIEAATARLSEAQGQFEGVSDGDFEMIRRGPGGRPQIVATGRGRWSKRIEDRFFAVLEATGNVSAAARAVGFTTQHIGERRRQWPAFARRWEEALEQAEAALEFRLVCLGNNLDPSAPAGEGRAAMPEPPQEKFDPQFALQFLKWREEKKAGRGRRGRAPREPGIEEVKESILRKIEAIERHRKRGN